MKIPYRIVTAHFRVDSAFVRPFFSGSLYRGLLRRALGSVACAEGDFSRCGDHCRAPATCPLGQLLHPPLPVPLPHRSLGGIEEAPSPLIPLFPRAERRELKRRAPFTMRFVLIGDSPELHLETLRRGLPTLEDMPIHGGGRLLYQRMEVGREQTLILKEAPDAWGTLVLQTETPLSLRRAKKQQTAPPFKTLLAASHRRLTGLAALYGEVDDDAEERFREWVEVASEVRLVRSTLRVETWRRSPVDGNQHTIQAMLGELRYEGNIGPFKTLVQAMPLTLVGAKVNFGLGRLHQAWYPSEE